MKELQDKKCVSAKTQFEYAWCLIRSKYGADINNGIKIFEGLCKDNPEDKRDYIYYLAIAYCRIKDFPTSQKYVKAFLEIEPNNQQVLLLDVSSFQISPSALALTSLLTTSHSFRNISRRK